MNVEEFSNEFDVKLNSYLREHPYGTENGIIDFTIDEYQKSLFLTESLYEFVRGFYTGQQPFEWSEESRRNLSKLLSDAEINTDNNTISKTDGNGYIYTQFKLPNDLWWIIHEKAVFDNSYDNCINSKEVSVVPVVHDELNHILENPFKCPNKKKVLRLDFKDNVDLVSKYKLNKYKLRYIRKPKPIITAYLPDNVTIDGLSTPSECELIDSTHKIILDMAVSKAYNTLMLDKLATQDNDNKKSDKLKLIKSILK